MEYDGSHVTGMDIGSCNYTSCMHDLFFQLATIVIVKQLLSNFAEIGLPLVMSKVAESSICHISSIICIGTGSISDYHTMARMH